MPDEDPTPGTTASPARDRAALLLRVLAMLVLAAVAAAGLAALKGRGLDAAYVLGNSSVTYLLLPFLAGWLMPRRTAAVILGIGVTFVALTTFYFTASTLYLGSLSIDFSLGRWFLAGVVSGTLLALFGRAGRNRHWLLYLVPALLVLEPIATAAAAGLGIGSGAPQEAVLIAGLLETGTGILALVLLTRHAQKTHH